jgi:hypothetical protein
MTSRLLESSTFGEVDRHNRGRPQPLRDCIKDHSNCRAAASSRQNSFGLIWRTAKESGPMTMNANQIVDLIERAFSDIPKSEVSLRQFRLTDLYGMSREITDEEWEGASRNRVDESWQEIPDSEIEECDCILAHMEAEEFLYYLPAYMRYSVKHITTPISTNDILGSTVFSLYPSMQNADIYEYKERQLSLLNEGQRKSVVEFLKFVTSNAGWVQRPDAEKALNRYWYKRNDT